VYYEASPDIGTTFTGSYRCDPIVPSVARRELKAWLRGRTGPGENIDDAILVISELVTNAVIHAKTAASVVVEMAQTEIAVAVHDGSQALPALIPFSGERAGGVGLRVVDALTREWGWTSAASGKKVWAVLDRHKSTD